jgi:hypothetical protein
MEGVAMGKKLAQRNRRLLSSQLEMLDACQSDILQSAAAALSTCHSPSEGFKAWPMIIERMKRASERCGQLPNQETAAFFCQFPGGIFDALSKLAIIYKGGYSHEQME